MILDLLVLQVDYVLVAVCWMKLWITSAAAMTELYVNSSCHLSSELACTVSCWPFTCCSLLTYLLTCVNVVSCLFALHQQHCSVKFYLWFL